MVVAFGRGRRAQVNNGLVALEQGRKGCFHRIEKRARGRRPVGQRIQCSPVAEHHGRLAFREHQSLKRDLGMKNGGLGGTPAVVAGLSGKAAFEENASRFRENDNVAAEVPLCDFQDGRFAAAWAAG